jgi:hypothetical protein
MVKGHKDALSFLNDSIDNTKNEALKKYLLQVRDTIQKHFDHAKTLKDELKK